MIILAFDTSMSACSAGLYDAGQKRLLSARSDPMNRGQAERLIPMVEDIFSHAHLKLEDVDLIACTHGPGAFTGLRLSMAAAKSFSLALNKPVIGISTLQAMSKTARIDKIHLVCLETKRRDFYVQVFDACGIPLNKPAALSARAVQELIEVHTPKMILGDAAERLHTELSLKISWQHIPCPETEAIASIASKNYDPNGPRHQNMTPLYLRGADVSFPATRK